MINNNYNRNIKNDDYNKIKLYLEESFDKVYKVERFTTVDNGEYYHILCKKEYPKPKEGIPEQVQLMIDFEKNNDW